MADDIYIMGAWDHPTRNAVNRSLPQLYADICENVLADAGLDRSDVDGLFLGNDAPGTGPLSIRDYLNLTNVRHFDTSHTSGSSYTVHVGHAVDAIRAGRCSVALVMQASRTRQSVGKGPLGRLDVPDQPDFQWEHPMGTAILTNYGMVAMRHMHEFGTTSEQLAWIKVAASHHAALNPHALYPKLVTVVDVVNAPVVADPFHKLDCCIISDGGGGLLVVREDIARSLKRPLVRVRGQGLGLWGQNGGDFDLTRTGAVQSGAMAYAEAGVTPADIQYASLYDSFTITVLLQLEDLGFCPKGAGGRFVEDGKLIAGHGPLPVNTDGGGLCNNHPGNRGGMVKVIETVKQLRGEANPGTQVPNCTLALANAIGGQLGVRHASATLILERV